MMYVDDATMRCLSVSSSLLPVWWTSGGQAV